MYIALKLLNTFKIYDPLWSFMRYNQAHLL